MTEEDAVPAPKLVPADAVAQQKGKNKRAAEDSPATAAAEKTINGGDASSKLTKAQKKKAQKKLKNNAGAAVDAVDAGDEQDTSMTESAKAASPAASAAVSKGDKKVQFASTLVQGPSSSSAKTDGKKTTPGGDSVANAKGGKASLGVKTVDGVTIDDKKLGAGPAAKKGDKVSMRYIGKLDADKRVFDCKLSLAFTPSPRADSCEQRTKRARPSLSSSAQGRSSRAGTLAWPACRRAASVESPSRRTWPTAARARRTFPPTRPWCLI